MLGPNCKTPSVVQSKVDDEEAVEEEEDEDKEASKKKMTKSELYRMYAGKSPTRMFLEFMLDLELKNYAVIIATISAPLEDAPIISPI